MVGRVTPRVHGTLRTVYRHLSYDGADSGSAMASDMGGNGEGGAGRGKVPQEYQTSASECGRSAALGRRRGV